MKKYELNIEYVKVTQFGLDVEAMSDHFATFETLEEATKELERNGEVLTINELVSAFDGSLTLLSLQVVDDETEKIEVIDKYVIF